MPVKPQKSSRNLAPLGKQHEPGTRYCSISLFDLSFFRLLQSNYLVSNQSRPPMTQPSSYFIAPDGDDSWSGTLAAANPQRTDGPWASLEGARDQLRQHKRGGQLDGGAVVNLRGGVYRRSGPFLLEAADSGTAAEPIIFRAAPGEQPRLLGGQILTAFTPIADPTVRQRLAPQARDQVVQCDLKACGIADWGHFASRGFGRPRTPAHLELFCDGQRQQVARWPNDDFTHITAPARPDPTGDDHGGELGLLPDGFLYAGDRPRTWKSLDHIWLHGYWAWDWANSYEALDSFDPDSGRITTRPPHGTYGFRAGQRFYFLNILEELDCPGEYYLDPDTGLLYFWPPAPLDQVEITASLVAAPLVHLQEARHIVLEGLGLECGRDLGVLIEGGEKTEVRGCQIGPMGTWGIRVEGGTQHRITSCDIFNTGDGGLSLNGGDRTSLTPARHRATNNHIHHMGQWSRCYQPGINLAGVGHRVSHNLIHDGPHNAIQLHGNEHIIEYNHIHHVCSETGDVGAFYMGRDWTERGHILRHNFFHHIHGLGMGSMAVYLDDCASGVTIFGNIFYQCSRAVFIGGGRNNRVENNIFVACEPAVHIDGRGLDERPVWRNMVHQTMKERLDAVDHQQPPYRQRYPDLRELDMYYREGAGIPPEGNLIVRNLVWRGTWLDITWHANPDLLAVQRNFVDEEPHFVDEAGLDFQLRLDAPVFELGFKPIPAHKIGLYLDQYRTHQPAAADPLSTETS